MLYYPGIPRNPGVVTHSGETFVSAFITLIIERFNVLPYLHIIQYSFFLFFTYIASSHFAYDIKPLSAMNDYEVASRNIPIDTKFWAKTLVKNQLSLVRMSLPFPRQQCYLKERQMPPTHLSPVTLNSFPQLR